jgi:NAD(P)-dependent dehydrogenase (short-subunit alcohol dehydrogenase family)
MKKIILITGASGGIGAATAYLAASQGYTVCINYLQNHEAANRIIADIRKYGVQAYAFQADISNEQQVENVFKLIEQQVGKISVLVNNAALIKPQQKLSEMSAERISSVFSTNVLGSFLCCREAIKHMSTKNNGSGGSIVNISSVASRLGGPFEYIDYAASKGAIDTLTIGLAKEVAAENIRVNAVRPGIIYTEIHGKAGEPGRVERLKESIPMKRGGHPDEVAKTILWLASDDASYITGAIVDVAGGR